jgi:hypothetical protein
MALYNWFKSNRNSEQDVQVVKLPEQYIEMGEMASAHPTGAAASIKRMMAQTNGPAKILVVGDGRYSKKLRDYSLKMAQRLDCEIVALNMSEPALPFAGPGAGAGNGMFAEIPVGNLDQFMEQSQVMGVNIMPVMESGAPENVITRLSEQDPAIRYVLTEPDFEGDNEIGEMPILDLAYPYNDI